MTAAALHASMPTDCQDPMASRGLTANPRERRPVTPEAAGSKPATRATARTHASHDVRDTSRTAYAEQRASGRLNNTQQRIVDLLRAHPGRDYTRSEIGRALGLPINVVTGRVNELIHLKHMAEERGKRACAVSGKVVYAVGLR